MADEIEQLVKAIYREKAARACAMSPEEKLLAGEVLFRYAAEITKAGIRSQNPTWSEAEVSNELRRRLAFSRRLESGKKRVQ